MSFLVILCLLDNQYLNLMIRAQVCIILTLFLRNEPKLKHFRQFYMADGFKYYNTKEENLTGECKEECRADRPPYELAFLHSSSSTLKIGGKYEPKHYKAM